ncbi:MAG TPA: sulfate ABC transporter ATP-binding protein [Bacillota bacterium]|nr:sulfate ABC transporter ATP-binding protein [Bacillota bacterium]HOL09706.1 sulfate ABC transporter ATP-binding protein [Bacillota bacterium]HPO97295.1 sulfate ABC transporter ATP-binding protein [Bacillota bacterium]
MSIVVKDVSKRFGSFQALNSINLEIPTGELVALLGPSGSGKTTLLRIIAGLENASSGSIYFQGEDATEKKIQERQVGFVFQHYALFRHMTVFDNVAFGLRVKPAKLRPSEAEIKEKVNQLLKLVQMDWLGNRYPSQLSGGQRQRIALARALAVEPKILLLDEPFGALDAKVRKELRRWIRQLHDAIHLTSIFVTHDQEEALEVADRIVVMNEGKIEQVGTPEEVYDNPASPFVYQFLGNVNLFRGRLDSGRIRIGTHEFATPNLEGLQEQSAIAYVRPYELAIERNSSETKSIKAIVSYIRAIGPVVRLELNRKDNGELIEAEISKERFNELKLASGDEVYVGLNNLKVFVEDYVI